MAQRAITANRLHDGAVIWQKADGEWVEDIGLAMVSDVDEDAAAALASAKRMEAAGLIIGAYEIEVEIDAARLPRRPRPVRLRERIRAEGPTVTFGR